MDKIECIKCKIKTTLKDSKNPIFPCDACRNYYCGDCSDLSPSEIKCMPLQKRILKFHCVKCRNGELTNYLKNTITDKESIIEDKTTIIKILQDKINNLEKTQNSYAQVASKQACSLPRFLQASKNIPAVIIKPIHFQEAQKTKEDVQATINPKQMNVSINSINAKKDGKVIIKCATEEGTQRLVAEAEKQLQNKYKVELSRMKKPRIKIIAHNIEKNESEIEDCLREQNAFINSSDYIKVTYMRKNQQGKQIIFAECSGELFTTIMDVKKIFIDWERCPVYEDISIPRCKRCFAFDHKETNCNNKLTCTYCGRDHLITNCPKDLKQCCNCIRSVSKFKLNYDIKHEAYNKECPTLKFYIQRYKSNVDYYSK